MAVASNDGGGPQTEPEALLETALRHCERVTADPAAGAAALDAASAAAAVLLRLAETSELETAVRCDSQKARGAWQLGGADPPAGRMASAAAGGHIPCRAHP